MVCNVVSAIEKRPIASDRRPKRLGRCLLACLNDGVNDERQGLWYDITSHYDPSFGKDIFGNPFTFANSNNTL